MAEPLNIGPVQVEYDDGNVGLVKDGATVNYERSTVTTTADITGDTPRQKVVTGQSLKVTGAITEATLAQIAKLLNATVVTGTTDNELRIVNQVGLDLIPVAKKLVLKPIVQGVVSTDPAEWFYVPKASVNPALAVVYKHNDQKMWGFEFEGHPLTADDVASGGDWAGGEWVAGEIGAWGRAD